MSTSSPSYTDLNFVNTHALGKFEFCARAGTIAYEKQPESDASEDAYDEPSIPRLDYLPIFDTALLDEHLKKASKKLSESLLALLVFSLLAIVVLLWVDRFAGVLLILSLYLLGRKSYLHFKECREIQRRLTDAKQARLAKLESPPTGIRVIDWWGLCLGENFSSLTPESSYQSDKLRLTGKPARVATYLGRDIPVILHRGELRTPKPYHMVRLAAYALLVKENYRGKDVEWGIILNPETMKGLAVPIGQAERERAKAKLTAFHTSLRATQNGTDPIGPPESFCEDCPYGDPRSFSRSESGRTIGEILSPTDARGFKRSRKYPSPCGHRFQWIPPHREVIELKKKADGGQNAN